MDQHKSFFFRLPRELRDKIYIYYVSEEHGEFRDSDATGNLLMNSSSPGYLHNSSTRKLRLHDGRLIDQALLFTCKRMNQEMKGLALRNNSITFRTQVSLPEAIDMHSDAALFENLRWRRNGAVCRMLSFAHSLLTPNVLQLLRKRWPESKAVAGLKERIERNGTEPIISNGLELYLDDVHINDTQEEEITDDIVQLIRNHPDFDALTSIGWTKSNWYRWQLNGGYTDEEMRRMWEDDSFENEAVDHFFDDHTGSPWYTEASRYSMLDWNAQRWEIPRRDDLEQVERLWPEDSHNKEHVRYCVQRLYYSATAVTLQFLEQLPLEIRIHIREIIIEEDNPAVNEPYTHIRGMARFWQENPRLKVEHRVEVWKTILLDPQHWDRSAILSICDWIQQARAACTQNEGGSYSLILHGPSTSASQNLSDVMVRLAKWQIGNAEFLDRAGQEFDKWDHCVSEYYPNYVRDIVESGIPVRFEAEYVPEPWDPATILREHFGDWPLDHREATERYAFEEPEGGWKAARDGCWIEFDSYDNLEWWNALVVQLEEHST